MPTDDLRLLAARPPRPYHGVRRTEAPEMSSSEAVTRGIRVVVRSRYLPERSRPEQSHWFFAYTIRIENEIDRRVQLVSRHWIITDAHERVEEVRGPGVVG